MKNHNTSFDTAKSEQVQAEGIMFKAATFWQGFHEQRSQRKREQAAADQERRRRLWEEGEAHSARYQNYGAHYAAQQGAAEPIHIIKTEKLAWQAEIDARVATERAAGKSDSQIIAGLGRDLHPDIHPELDENVMAYANSLFYDRNKQ